jgi:hypothetical protein
MAKVPIEKIIFMKTKEVILYDDEGCPPAMPTDCTNVYSEINRTHVKKKNEITYLYCLVIDRVDTVYFDGITMSPTTTRPPISIACGDAEIGWVDVMSTATEMPSDASGKL